jgi:hypothetical protein
VNQSVTKACVLEIAGAWRLQSWRIHYDDGRSDTLPFWKRPYGSLLYTPDGWMSAAVCRNDRDRCPGNQSPRDLDDRLLAAAFQTYFHYAGPYRIEGDWVIHTVRQSLNPGFVGSEQRRHMTLEGPLLTLRGSERIGTGNRHHELVWRRASPEMEGT